MRSDGGVRFGAVSSEITRQVSEAHAEGETDQSSPMLVAFRIFMARSDSDLRTE